MTHPLRTLAVTVALTVGAAVPLAACSSSGSSDTAAVATTTTVASTTPATAAPDSTTTTAASSGDGNSDGDLGTFCDGFAQLVAGRDPDDRGQLDFGDGSPEDVAAAYAAQLDAVEEMDAGAPADMADNTQAYIEMIHVRADAAAETGATSIQDLPADQRADFIAAESTNQQLINELIQYAGSTCSAG